MWGHAPSCACSICTTLSRIFPLVNEGSGIPNFISLAGRHFRVLEGELRDTLDALLDHGRSGPPKAAAAPPPPPVAQPEQSSGPLQRESTASASQAPAAPPAGPPEQFLYPKSKPAEPGKTSEGVEFKVEPHSSPDQLVDAEELEPRGPEAAKKPKASTESSRRTKSPVIDVDKKRKHKDKRRTRSRSRRRRRKTTEAKSPKREEEARRSRKRSRTRSIPASRGRERKERPSSPRRSPLRPKSPPFPPWPRSPSQPPPGHREARGSGWRGPVPYSSHPRWTEGKNKGVTKRAKQERYNQRHSGHGR